MTRQDPDRGSPKANHAFWNSMRVYLGGRLSLPDQGRGLCLDRQYYTTPHRIHLAGFFAGEIDAAWPGGEISFAPLSSFGANKEYIGDPDDFLTGHRVAQSATHQMGRAQPVLEAVLTPDAADHSGGGPEAFNE